MPFPMSEEMARAIDILAKRQEEEGVPEVECECHGLTVEWDLFSILIWKKKPNR